MPPGRRSSRHTPDTLNINAFDPRVLDTSDGVHVAIRAVKGVCNQGDPEIARMVSVLLGHSDIIGYIISGMLRAPIGSHIPSTDDFTFKCWMKTHTRRSRSG